MEHWNSLEDLAEEAPVAEKDVDTGPIGAATFAFFERLLLWKLGDLNRLIWIGTNGVVKPSGTVFQYNSWNRCPNHREGIQHHWTWKTKKLQIPIISSHVLVGLSNLFSHSFEGFAFLWRSWKKHIHFGRLIACRARSELLPCCLHIYLHPSFQLVHGATSRYDVLKTLGFQKWMMHGSNHPVKKVALVISKVWPSGYTIEQPQRCEQHGLSRKGFAFA